MEASQELKDKFVWFLINKLEDFIEESLLINHEKIEVAILQRPEYDAFLREYKTRGLLRIGSDYHPGKYYPIEIKANRHYIFIRIKPLYTMRISWGELEEATQKEGGNQ